MSCDKDIRNLGKLNKNLQKNKTKSLLLTLYKDPLFEQKT